MHSLNICLLKLNFLDNVFILRLFLHYDRGEIQAWDLQSLLIKPVQRVLKYPLLLDKLAECTPSKHPDHKQVLEARAVIEKVAQDINEIKRRKDLGMCV